MNPRSEDFERLAIRWANSSEAARAYPDFLSAITAFPEQYVRSRDALPQNDADRAFALTGRASDMLDRSIVTAETEEAALQVATKAAALIDEALKLDPTCYDAVRIRRYLGRPTRDEMETFLAENAPEVCEMCQAAARENSLVPPDGHWSASVYLRPYLRWLFDLAGERLSCGRYRRALETCLQALDLDAEDAVGARHVAAFVLVKLEDAEGLARLLERFPGDNNAWFLLARCFMAYKQRRLDDATAVLHQILRAFPAAGCTLTYQDELPPGMFSHLEYADGSADELYVAVSEAAVILDENCGDAVSPLSDWIANDPEVAAACAREEARAGKMPARSGGQQPSGERPVRSGAAPAMGEELGFDGVDSVEDLLAALSRTADGQGQPGPDAPQTDQDDPSAQGR